MTLSLVDFLILLVVAGICGAIGQALAGFSGRGILASIALGFIGALLARSTCLSRFRSRSAAPTSPLSGRSPGPLSSSPSSPCSPAPTCAVGDRDREDDFTDCSGRRSDRLARPR
jgi:uncharacterized membrane protein YeaQ/YmgE (transglycosylase-associated protein family)